MQSIERDIIAQVREFVAECDIDNYGNIGEMAQEAEHHRLALAELLKKHDDLWEEPRKKEE